MTEHEFRLSKAKYIVRTLNVSNIKIFFDEAIVKTETLSLDFDTSAKLAGLIHALPKNCWKNAFNALSHLPGGWYVEGWLIIDGILYEHGWCEWEGKVVDPTLYNQLGRRYFYLPGIKYSIDDVVKRVQKKSVKLPFVWHEEGAGFGGFRIKSYRDAYNKAQSIRGFKNIYT
jgi:hypothetical protein